MGVGKTAIHRAFNKKKFESNSKPTVGGDFVSIPIQVRDDHLKKNVNVILHVWDTSGQERFMSIVRTYYRGAEAIIYVFDTNSNTSFDNISEKWIPLIKEEMNYYETILEFGDPSGRSRAGSITTIDYVPNKVFTCLIGNKNDLEKMVSSDGANTLIQKEQMYYYWEVSMKNKPEEALSILNVIAKYLYISHNY